jgi:isopentenyldiphosphate isomerase
MAKKRIIIVNNQDQIIGYKERGSLAPDDIYRVTALWVTNTQGDILLAQRKLTKDHDPGKWGPAVAGTVDEGDTYDSNISEGAEAELGLVDIQPTKGPKRRASNEHNYFTQWYTLVINRPAQDFTTQENEVEQVKWFTRNELQADLQAHSDQYLTGLDWSVENL